MMTINQIMLLLDIHRGTATQSKIGTRSKDLKVLKQRGLLLKNSDWELTAKGDDYIKSIQVAVFGTIAYHNSKGM